MIKVFIKSCKEIIIAIEKSWFVSKKNKLKMSKKDTTIHI